MLPHLTLHGHWTTYSSVKLVHGTVVAMEDALKMGSALAIGASQVCYVITYLSSHKLMIVHLGHDCSQPLVSTLYRNFKDDFEGDFKTIKSSSSNSVRAKWESLMGGIVGYGGCGTLGPFGFGRSVYFNSCGKRWLRTNEMDLRRGRCAIA